MTPRPLPRFLSFVALCLALAACQDQSGERVEALGQKVHRLTVDLAGDEPAEARLAKDAAAICPAGYDRPDDEPMPPDNPRYRVWLVRCR
jgi:ferredoxin